MGYDLNNPAPYVVYWNNLPAPYMVDRFNALADRGNMEFEAWFNDRQQLDRSWDVDESNWRFRYRYLPTTNIFGRKFHWPTFVLGRRPDVLVSLYAEPAFLVGWAIARLRGVKTCFRVLKTYDRWVARHPIKEILKHIIFRCVDGVETIGDDGKMLAMHYGTSAERIFFATHTVDIEHYESTCSALRGKQAIIRHELQLKGTVFIYVGRLWWGKGLDYLLQAFEQVQCLSDEEVSLLLVGDGPENDALQQTCENCGIRNVVFAGYSQGLELARLYAVSDVFVFPTLGDPYGIVVDEAMACSLPIISTSAVGEIADRIEEGVNGYIVPPEDSKILAKRMLQIVKNTQLRLNMGSVSAEKVADNTPEQWAKDFELIVEQLLLEGSS